MKNILKNILKSMSQKSLARFTNTSRLSPTLNVIDAFSLQRMLIPSKTPVIFDVGACVGSISEKYRLLFPYSYIYCFEPYPTHFEKLQEKFENNALTFCYKLALSDKCGISIFSENAFSETNSLLETDSAGISYWGQGLVNTASKIQVQTITIDSFLSKEKISHIDILKLDAQGGEFSILTGGMQTLLKHQVSLIYCEIILCPTYQGQHKLCEYLSLLDSLNYELVDFFNPIRSRHQLIQADFIFAAPSVKKYLDDCK